MIGSIFKIKVGVLSEVLKFYGHAHVCAILLNKLCKASRKIFRDYDFSIILAECKMKIKLREEEMKSWLKNK